MIDIYQKVKQKANQGDLKAIDMMLKLQREINAHGKEADSFFTEVIEGNEEDELQYS